jgi:phosphomannomutase
VKEKRADVGFAQDPDADRLAIVDERGEYIGEEYTLALCAEAVLGAMGKAASGGGGGGGGTVCVNLSTSRMIEDVCARHGVRVIRTAVGEANVVEAMKKNGSVFGGEGNGGVIWPKVTYIRDSLSGMGLILALMARTEKTVSQLVAEIPSYAIVKRKVDLTDLADAARAVAAVKKAYAAEKLDTQDGVRVDFESKRAWLHVRGSNTEPIMRLIAEAPTTAIAEQILDEAARVIAKG